MEPAHVASSLSAYLPELAIAAALAWGSGLRAYAVIFATGLAGALGWVELPGYLGVLQHPIVLVASGLMTLVELFADKLPWLDSVWDAVHSFIRIPAGAALAAAVFGDSGAATAVAAALLGGTLTAAVHAAKAGTRAALNTSPEPFSNWSASLAEDAIVPAGLWLAVAHPIAFFVLLALFLLGALLVVRFIWRGLAALLQRVR
jgi:hypothetical protein